jgi:hypothetical protein
MVRLLSFLSFLLPTAMGTLNGQTVSPVGNGQIESSLTDGDRQKFKFKISNIVASSNRQSIPALAHYHYKA